MSRQPITWRVREPSTWGGIGGLLLTFAMFPSSVIPDLPVIPWQIRIAAFAAALVCYVIQIIMREWPNK